MKKRTWLLGSAGLLAAVVGGTLLWANFKYDPLLFHVGDVVVRQAEWEQLKPKIFNGMTPTVEDEKEGLERRAMEELVLIKAQQAGLTVDEASVEKQISQAGATPEERATAFKELGLTEEDVKNNYRRALLGFQLKAKMTADVTVTDKEVVDFYEQNKQAYFAPEFRSVHYLKAKVSDQEVTDALQNATAATFPELATRYNDSDKERTGGLEDMVGQNPLRDSTSAVFADAAFGAPKDQLLGPLRDGEWNYWYLVTDIKEPKQFQLMEVRQKIMQTLLEEKQLSQYRGWLQEQKQVVGYYTDQENVQRSKLAAFWNDLPENWNLLF